MQKYRVKWDYKSDLGGPWKEGEVLELVRDLAAHINRSSPGVLAMIRTRSRKKPAQKRQVVKASADRGG